MSEDFLIGLSAIILLGIGAQWLAWWLRLPAILLLLVFGTLAGAGTEWLSNLGVLEGRFLDPDHLLGEMLLPFVSLSVAVILFEGGLTLSVTDLSKAGRTITKLVTIGALATWMVSMLAAWGILGIDSSLALLLGAILVVTGPTVIGPLLRHVRPVGPVGGVLKWEGIVIDPIGAALAVIVFEAIPTDRLGDVTAVVLGNVLRTVFIGGAVGVVCAVLLVGLMRKFWLPDYLQSPIALMLVIAAFTGSNLVQSESGLFSVTVMGIFLGSQRFVQVRHILEFKENLTVLLISTLFIVLGARLRLEDLSQFDWRIVLFLLALILVARPLTVLVSTVGSKLTWPERTFLMCMAPRGIVAAAVSSVFALRLQAADYAGAELLVPYTFAVIIGTVGFYGLIAAWAAKRLGLADPGKRGFLVAGANPLARMISVALKEEGYAVLLVDTNRGNLGDARLAGLPTFYGSVLSQYVLDRIELSGIGRLLALTPNEEVNSLASLHFSRVFGRSEVYQLAAEGPESSRVSKVSTGLRGRELFGRGLTYEKLDTFLSEGATIRKTTLTREFDYKKFRSTHQESAIPLFVIDETRQLSVVTTDKSFAPKAGQTVISLMKRPEVPNPTIVPNTTSAAM